MAFSPGPIRKYLFALVIAIAIPLLVFSGAMVYVSYDKQREAIARGLSDTANALSAALDREFAGSIQALKILASSTILAENDLSEFYKEMKRTLAAYGQPWQNITLTDRTGQQLINLRRPFGSPLPRLDPELIARDLQTGEATISNLFTGPVTSMPSIVVSVPVRMEGQIKYLLRAGIPTARLSELLSQQKLPTGWLATIVDRNQIIAARTRDLEKFLGKPASATFAAQARQNREASWRGTTLEGVEVVSSLRRSELTGWTVGLAIPAADFDAPLRTALTLAGVMGFALFGTGLFFAAGITRRVALSTIQLADGAQALGRGETLRIPPSSIVELNEVARAIEAAAEKRDQVEKALRESEDRYRDLVEHSQDLICTHDLDGRILSVNPWAAKVLGYEQAELLNMNVRDVLASSVRQEFDGYLAAIRTDGAARGLMLVQSRAGEKRVWEYNNTLRTEGMLTPIVRGMAHDITEHKRAEAALRESEEKFRILAEASVAAIFVFQDEQLRYANPAATTISGYANAELLNLRFWDLIHPDFRELVRQRGLARQRGETVRTRYEVKILTKEGDERWVDFGGGFIIFEGKPAAIGVALDITARKQAEKERDAVSHRNKALVTALGQIVYDWRPPADELIWEGDFTKVLGYPPQEMGTTTESWTSRVHPEDLDRVLAEVERSTRERRGYKLDYRFRHRDGSYRWMHDSGVLTVSPQGELERIIGVFVDNHRAQAGGGHPRTSLRDRRALDRRYLQPYARRHDSIVERRRGKDARLHRRRSDWQADRVHPAARPAAEPDTKQRDGAPRRGGGARVRSHHQGRTGDQCADQPFADPGSATTARAATWRRCGNARSTAKAWACSTWKSALPSPAAALTSTARRVKA